MLKVRLVIIASIVFLCINFTTKAQKATFDISTTGTNAQIDSAIEYALDIWSNTISSTVPIKANIFFTPFPSLGFTLPNGIKNFSGAPLQDVWYPTCLANAITGTELNPGEVDMDIYIGSNKTWYFGTDGNPGPGEFDFVSVLLHEIGHGLGFTALAKLDSSIGSIGWLTLNDFWPILSTFPFPDLQGYPGTFDLLLVDENGNSLVDTNFYPNRSIILGQVFRSNKVYLQGLHTLMNNDSISPRVYAPSTWTLGSSMTHLDENTYKPVSGNALMTPSSSMGESTHEAGPIVLGVLEDIGWTLFVPSAINEKDINNSDFTIFPNPAINYINISFTGNSNSIIKVELIDPLGNIIFIQKKFMGKGKGITQLSIDKLPAGLYFIKITAENKVISRSFFKTR